MAVDKEQLKNLYKTYEGRDVSEDEMSGWYGFTGTPQELEAKFKEASSLTTAKNPFGNPISDVNPMGYQPGNKPLTSADWETFLKGQYEAKMPQIESDIRGVAAGGGLDTGGYMTSLAKAKTASWSDMLANIMQAKQSQQSLDWSKQLPLIQRKWAGEDWEKSKNLALEIADLSKPGDWEKFLAAVNAGANVVDAFIPG